MKKYFKFFIPVFLFAVVILIFKQWFLPGLISGGDFWPFYKSTYFTRPISLYAWDWGQGIGLGGFSGALLWIYLTFGVPVTIFGKYLGLGWIYVERIYFLYPFLALNLATSFFLFKKLFNNNYSYLASAIYTLNSYSLMMAGGGQLGVGLAYSIAPLVLLTFINTLNLNKLSLRTLKFSLFSALALSLQIIFDLRIGYVTLLAVFIYWMVKNIDERKINYLASSILSAFIIPGTFSVLLNFFWMLPTILNRQNPLGQFGAAYTSPEAVKFFSFAKFENTISLLHPNWPENIFGKVGFMKPEFLILPILAFASIFFVYKTRDLRFRIYIIFFALLGIAGAFLAKGVSDPFGNIYLWMFDHFPGFIMFRDPTKWYGLVAISYAILIPFTVWKTYELLRSQTKLQILSLKPRINSKNRILNLQNLFIVLIVLYFLFLIRPAIFDQLTGTFKSSIIPSDYVKLENFLISKENFSRVLWVPTNQRFGYYSPSHPAVPANDLLNLYDNSKLITKIASSESFLQNRSIKYIVVPYDSQGEIFLKDRKYDNNLYLQTINNLSKITYLKKLSGFGKVAVFEVPNSKGHFYINGQDLSGNNQLSYRYINPVSYELKLSNIKKGNILIFSENFDKNWIVKNPDLKVSSVRYGDLNSFVLPKDGTYSLDVYYTLQDWVNLGGVISVATLIFISGVLTIFYIKKV